MSHVKQILILSIFALIIAGCSSKTSVKKGDQFIVQEEMRENAEIRLDGYVDGVKVTLPEGTTLEVLYTPPSSGNYMECIPVVLNENKDPEEIESILIPERFLLKEGYNGYSLAIKREYIGTKIKKVKKVK